MITLSILALIIVVFAIPITVIWGSLYAIAIDVSIAIGAIYLIVQLIKALKKKFKKGS